MAWIGMGDCDAAGLRQLLDTSNARVDLSTAASAVVLHNADGLLLKQGVTETSWQYVGLTREAAEALASLAYDATSCTTLYAQGASGEWVACNVTMGASLKVSSAMANAAGGWTATFRLSEYGAANAGDAWSATRPEAAVSTGIQKSQSTSVYRVAPSEVSGGTMQKVVTTVVEFKFLTLAEALEMLNATWCSSTVTPHSTSSSYVGHTYNEQGAVVGSVSKLAHYTYLYGTQKTGSVRYVGTAEGYSLEGTTTVYSGV